MLEMGLEVPTVPANGLQGVVGVGVAVIEAEAGREGVTLIDPVFVTDMVEVTLGVTAGVFDTLRVTEGVRELVREREDVGDAVRVAVGVAEG